MWSRGRTRAPCRTMPCKRTGPGVTTPQARPNVDIRTDAAMLQRRHAAALRLPPLDCGCRDPLWCDLLGSCPPRPPRCCTGEFGPPRAAIQHAAESAWQETESLLAEAQHALTLH